MNLLFIISGVGYGHATRALSIIQLLKHRIYVATYGPPYYLFKKLYPTTRIREIKLSDKNFKLNLLSTILSNRKLYSDFKKNYKLLSSLIKRKNIDLVITDSEPIAVYTAKKLNKKIIAIHNHNLAKISSVLKEEHSSSFKLSAKFLYKIVSWGNKNSDLVINPSLLGKRKSKGKIKIINPIIRELPKEDNSRLLRKLKLGKKPVLIMLGGSRFGIPLIEQLLLYLKNYDETFIIFGYKNFKRKNITSFKYNKNFLDYLKVSKAVITLAGYSTLSESIVLKKPMLVFPIKNHIEQYINGKTMLPYAQVEFNIANIEKSLHKFLTNLDSLQKKINKLKVKGTGSKEAASIISNFIKRA